VLRKGAPRASTTSDGKLAEAGQKLEQLKQKLDQLNARPK